MRCGFVLYNYSIRKNITNKPFSLGANAFPCNLQTYEEQQVSLKQQVTYKCKHWLIVNARLNVIHTSQFQLVNLGNTTRKKILVCKKSQGGGGGDTCSTGPHRVIVPVGKLDLSRHQVDEIQLLANSGIFCSFQYAFFSSFEFYYQHYSR